ncbi:MAG: Ni/Fe hydrogenase subunit alpha [Saprospirales bacterium]|jgi:NAD-reducing hydrogenase large subunit|nr:Ni/Fe hydrogenase subunit alpha [Saprospirales bacterium]MBK8921650.1 Ni/Fe hydrogenase subunit alpha [Saprospirales bacterium]
MSRKIVIDPVTRVEGHGRVTIHLDAAGAVQDAFFHIVEFRGFERFIQGRPYWEVPVLVQRLCGICPVSHHLAAAKAVDQLVGVDPEWLSSPATKLRRLLHYGQVFQSHALHFFYLAAPDLLFGADAPAAQRNVVALAGADKELARKGILMRKFGQEIIRAIAGKRIHGVAAIPGGMYRTLTAAERDYFLKDGDLPSIDTMIEWSKGMLEFIRHYHDQHRAWLDTFASYPTGHLALVRPDGALDLYHGRLRAIDHEGRTTLADVPTDAYAKYFDEAVEKWSYMKFPYLKSLGREKGWNRVGPLARLNVCDYLPTPLAEQARKEMFAYAGGNRVINHTMYTHWARLVEMLHCAEVMRDLLLDPEILSDDLQRHGRSRLEGIGIIEAPRGTLTHHYVVDEKGKIIHCNLIVSTTHNNEAMNRAVRWVARERLSLQPEITEGMLNEVEVAIRAYDPCLSCATHALGKMPLLAELYDCEGNCLQTVTRTSSGHLDA